MKNSDLKDFYSKVYRKGEQAHYTKLLLSKKAISHEKIEIMAEIQWKDKKVLDIGCGTGELAYLIAKKGAKNVVAVDYSTEAIVIAKQAYQHKNLRYECVDVSLIKDTFDVITLVGVLEHIDEPFVLLKRLKTLLKPKGSIIVTCPNWSNPRGYILLALKYFFDAKITLADIHYFTPIEFQKWASKLGMNLSWKTIEQEWGHGDKMITDFKKRLPPVLASTGVEIKKDAIASFVEWLETHVPSLEGDQRASGAVGFYHLKADSNNIN